MVKQNPSSVGPLLAVLNEMAPHFYEWMGSQRVRVNRRSLVRSFLRGGASGTLPLSPSMETQVLNGAQVFNGCARGSYCVTVATPYAGNCNTQPCLFGHLSARPSFVP